VDTRQWVSPSIRLQYTVQQTGERLDYAVGLQSTHPHRGGLRWWFICPCSIDGVPCRQRVAKLYLPPGAKFYGCRHCHNLTYTSRRENMPNRVLLKAQSIRRRLGGTRSLYDLFPLKPKRMRGQTYEELCRKAELAESRYFSLVDV
jgi:hypothetical protein